MIERPVLIVEDDSELAAALAEALEIAGIPSSIAVDGRAGLAALRKEAPSVILLDLMMPQMDGWKFRQQQQQMPDAASIPVIVMTASGRAEEKADALNASGYLDKPLALDALIAEVRRVARTAVPGS